jgi:agmatinase
MTDFDYFDSGDLELPFGNTKQAVADIAVRSEEILADGKLPFMIGGEHLVTLGSVMAVNDKYDDLHIVHFDAHADLRDDYLGQKMSHACVLRRCHELVGDGHIFQFGIRSGDREEFLFADEHTEMHKFSFDGLEETVEKLRGRKVYFTLDLDVLDPSVFPGTGTPEAGGVTFDELRRAVTLVCSELNIVGCDVNELSPVYDQSGVSTAVACKMIREMLLALS